MAAASSLEVDMKCSVCLDIYEDPRILPCGHEFCVKCLEQLADGDFVKCPECRTLHYVPNENVRNFTPDLKMKSWTQKSGCSVCHTIERRGKPCMKCYSSSCTVCLSYIYAESLQLETRKTQIFVRNLCGKTITIDNVRLTDSVRSIKNKLEEKDGVPADMQRLIFQGHQLQDKYPLNHYHVTEQSTLHLVLRLVGGHNEE